MSVRAQPVTKQIYFFDEGQTSKDLLGGKGAGLAVMTAAGLPVPPGFTIVTQASLKYYEDGKTIAQSLLGELDAALAELERRTGKRFGDVADPLLVSVRSGAKFSMPGMMDTILNVGLNDETVEGLARLTNNERFAWDAYRRLVTMYATTVFGIEKHLFEEILERHKRELGVETDPEVDAASWKRIVGEYKQLVTQHAKSGFPQEVRAQIVGAVEAVFNSWNSKRAIDYRRYNRLSDDLGTAVNIVQMVFGNLGDDSGTGVAFTRDPNTGERVLFGEYLQNAQGEDVVAGIRTPERIADLERTQPAIYRQFVEIAQRLERHYQDVQDIEFTVERGKLYMLQTRSAKRSAQAAVRIALDLVEEGAIDRRTALGRVDARALDQLFHARIDPAEKYEIACKGLNASPGAAAGRVVFTADDAVAWAERGEDVVLVRVETTPDDVHGMIAARGVLTAKGGATSHAAVVARGMGKPCVAGCEALHIDRRTKHASIDGTEIKEGDWVTIDGSSGAVAIGRLQLIPPPATLPERLATLLSWADEVRRLQVWANADTPEDARKARALGAQGIGLCRTEHMFMQQDRLPVVQEMILANTPEARESALARLLPFQREDFVGILEAMAGLPVTIRLLDPPLHEFLPSLETLLVETTELRLTKGIDSPEYKRRNAVLKRVQQMHEQNPMLGLRVCRLGILYPEIYAMQVRAIFEAACDLVQRGVDVRPEVMIPGVGSAREMRITYDNAKAVADEVLAERGVTLSYHIGTMVELPRACMIADDLILHGAEFFSFGTNDLTQTTYGFSRDDAENSFIPRYLEQRILTDDPFQVLDRKGVGALMQEAVRLGRSARPDFKIGICGEHGGEPSSVAFCEQLKLDYVSCSPYRVPIARLAAAQAAIGALQ
ncbi:MAG TPA: pyruvate, phosphate dikinase [Candidatus Tyrphobacter sp.]